MFKTQANSLLRRDHKLGDVLGVFVLDNAAY